MTVDPLFIHAMLLLGAVFVLQLALLMLGMTGPELADADAGADFDADVGADLEADGGSGGDLGADGGGFDLLGTLGLRGVPLMVWVCGWLAAFSGLGFFMTGLLSLEEPNWAVRAGAVAFAFVFARGFGKVISTILPNVTTSVVSLENARVLHGRLLDSPAAFGKPARVEVEDRNGGLHYFMAEPAEGQDEIPAYSQVTLLFATDPETGERRKTLIKT